MSAPDVIELDTGQMILAAEVEERGQTVLAELAPPPVPAPLNFTRDDTERAARDQLADLVEER